jgi:TIR domain
MEASPRVFISYSHDSREHEQAVLGLAARLRTDDVDARIDQYEMAPSQGWPRWMENEIEKADFVLLVCTKTYLDRVKMHAEPGKGLGALWEGNLIYQHIYEEGTVNSKFIPVLPAPGSVEHIPMPLRGAQRYSLFSDDGYNALYRRLTNQPAVPIPPLGRRRMLLPDGHVHFSRCRVPALCKLIARGNLIARRTFLFLYSGCPISMGRIGGKASAGTGCR